MVKLSGGSRTLSGGSREYSRREVEYNQLMRSGQYSSGYFSHKGGGYVLVERSSMTHSAEEIEAARYMADKGYIVTLTDESNKGKDSKVKTPDGKVLTQHLSKERLMANKTRPRISAVHYGMAETNARIW